MDRFEVSGLPEMVGSVAGRVKEMVGEGWG